MVKNTKDIWFGIITKENTFNGVTTLSFTNDDDNGVDDDGDNSRDDGSVDNNNSMDDNDNNNMLRLYPCPDHSIQVVHPAILSLNSLHPTALLAFLQRHRLRLSSHIPGATLPPKSTKKKTFF